MHAVTVQLSTTSNADSRDMHTVREQHSITSNAGCVPPDLVWGGLAVLPRGAPKPPNIAQGRPILNIVVYCVARQSQVPAVSLCFLDGNRTVTVQCSTYSSTASNKENHRTNCAFLSKSHFTD